MSTKPGGPASPDPGSPVSAQRESTTTGKPSEANDGPDYAVPALDKALDVLELLAARNGGLTQSEIADAVGRSVSQIFRVLQRLERRGWIFRERQSGLYVLSTRMLDLAHRHPPLRGLVELAIGPMRELAVEVHQSCNLSVFDAERVRVIAQVESPSDFGFRVRVGAEFPLTTPAGRVLGGEAVDGVLRQDDAAQPGITDLVVPVLDRLGGIAAALTVPYIATTFSDRDVVTVLRRLRATGELISSRLQGSPPAASR